MNKIVLSEHLYLAGVRLKNEVFYNLSVVLCCIKKSNSNLQSDIPMVALFHQRKTHSITKTNYSI